MKAFLIGLGLGYGIGLLVAPMSGEETRNNLVDRANDLAGSARDRIDDVKERAGSAIRAVRGGREQAEPRTGTSAY